MKTLLNLAISASIFLMMCDCENNANSPVVNYTITVYAVGCLLFFGFLRVYYKEFVEFLAKY